MSAAGQVLNAAPLVSARDVGTSIRFSGFMNQRNSRALREAWVFPGLGCRFVGMGNDLFESSGVSTELFGKAEAWLGYELRPVCLEGSGRKIVPPRQEAQIIYVLECAYAAELRDRGYSPASVAGHSLGNWATAWAAGTYDFLTGLELVTHVEELLEELVPVDSQTMGVIIGLDEATVRSLVDNSPDVRIANWNSPGQYIIGGRADAVDSVLGEAAKLNAKRAKRLPTDRALHTPCMNQVAGRLRQKLDQVHWSEPDCEFSASHDAGILKTASQIQEFLGVFLELPVSWETTIREICQRGTGHFVEVGPGNVLGSMLPFIEKTASSRSVCDILEQDRQS